MASIRWRRPRRPQHQVAKPAATDNWVHDAYGEPLLVVTSEMNEALTQVLEPILIEVKQLVGDRRPVVIFDRGGFSPKLFARLNKLGFDVMTYRKGKSSSPGRFRSSWKWSVWWRGGAMATGLAERPRVRVGRLRPSENARQGVRPAWVPSTFGCARSGCFVTMVGKPPF